MRRILARIGPVWPFGGFCGSGSVSFADHMGNAEIVLRVLGSQNRASKLRARVLQFKTKQKKQGAGVLTYLAFPENCDWPSESGHLQGVQESEPVTSSASPTTSPAFPESRHFSPKIELEPNLNDETC